MEEAAKPPRVSRNSFVQRPTGVAPPPFSSGNTPLATIHLSSTADTLILSTIYESLLSLNSPPPGPSGEKNEDTSASGNRKRNTGLRGGRSPSSRTELAAMGHGHVASRMAVDTAMANVRSGSTSHTPPEEVT